MGKRTHGEPDRFQWGGFAIDEKPASDEAALVAVKRFVDTFVVKHKRERVQADLVHAKKEQSTDQ
jgi:hypothetical protein